MTIYKKKNEIATSVPEVKKLRKRIAQCMSTMTEQKQASRLLLARNYLISYIGEKQGIDFLVQYTTNAFLQNV